MSEKINELIKSVKDLKYDSSTGTFETDRRALFEFAELTVRECIGCCEQVISDPVPESVDTFEQGGIHCMNEIKQHFGVE